jgi:hypothetical protein
MTLYIVPSAPVATTRMGAGCLDRSPPLTASFFASWVMNDIMFVKFFFLCEAVLVVIAVVASDGALVDFAVFSG